MRHTLALLLPTAIALTPATALAQHDHHHEHMAPPAAEAPPVEAPPQTARPADPHAGHTMPPPAHAGHTGHASDLTDPPVAPPPAVALSGPAHAADGLFGTPSMAAARKLLRQEHGGMASSKVFIDQLEAVVGQGQDGYAWQAEAWYGSDIDRLWFKTEGEGGFRSGIDAEVQALWSHAIDPWFNLHMGVRQDLGDGPDRTHVALGIAGLAPYWIEVDGALFLSEKGNLTARIEVEYDMRLTRRLILQPRAEIDVAAQDIPETGIGAGLSTAELGLRLRYEVAPEFAPYAGIIYQTSFGRTSALRRAASERTTGFGLAVGIRSWF